MADVEGGAPGASASAPPGAAPPPPAGWTMPAGYIAIKCVFCGFWTTCAMPYTPLDTSTDKWWPLMPWLRGKRDCPEGCCCLLCGNAARTSAGVFCFFFLGGGGDGG